MFLTGKTVTAPHVWAVTFSALWTQGHGGKKKSKKDNFFKNVTQQWFWGNIYSCEKRWQAFKWTHFRILFNPNVTLLGFRSTSGNGLLPQDIAGDPFTEGGEGSRTGGGHSLHPSQLSEPGSGRSPAQKHWLRTRGREVTAASVRYPELKGHTQLLTSGRPPSRGPAISKRPQGQGCEAWGTHALSRS